MKEVKGRLFSEKEDVWGGGGEGGDLRLETDTV